MLHWSFLTEHPLRCLASWLSAHCLSGWQSGAVSGNIAAGGSSGAIYQVLKDTNTQQAVCVCHSTVYWLACLQSSTNQCGLEKAHPTLPCLLHTAGMAGRSLLVLADHWLISEEEQVS